MPEPATTISIAGRAIGRGAPTYIIAELSANHGHSYEQAERLVHAAHEAGADAVKLQTYTADTMTIDCDAEPFRIGQGTIWEGRKLHDLYQEASMPWEWQAKLMALARDLGLHCFSTPFDETAVEFLEDLDVPAHKVASFELVDLPLLRRIAATGRPVILSTGMSTFDEIDEAVQVLRDHGTRELALLKCTSAYPAEPSDANLRTIPHLAETYACPVGLSDHTLGIAVPIAAVALGACIVEKHFTLSRDEPGPDSVFSLEPAEFRRMVDAIRVAEQALGGVRDGVSPREQASRVFRRSLFVVEPVKAGEVLTAANVRVIRPGNGLHPRHYDEVLGRRAARDLDRGTPMSWACLKDAG